MPKNDNNFQDYMDFDDIDNIYEVDSPREEECLWVGKPHVLCYIIDRNYIIFMFLLLIFWHFDFDFRWYSFVNHGILCWFIFHIIGTFKYAKTIQYYITKTHLIVKLEEQYWAYPRENIAIRRQKIKKFSKKAQFFFGLLGGFKQARFRQSIIEKLFGVKRLQFIKKDVYSPACGDSHDIYFEKGNFRCIKDYDKVKKLLGI